jgi:hypothetical protein
MHSPETYAGKNVGLSRNQGATGEHNEQYQMLAGT